MFLLFLIFSQTYNRQMGDGSQLEFEIVRFPNGKDPTSPPVSHPYLLNHRHLTTLNF